MTTHIDNDTGNASWILHKQLTRKYYAALEAIQDMHNFAYLLKRTLNGKKQAEQISENIFDSILKTHQDFIALCQTWALFDNEGFKERYDADNSSCEVKL